VHILIKLLEEKSANKIANNIYLIMRTLFFFCIVTLISCHTDPEILPELSECPSLSNLIEMLDYDNTSFGDGQVFIGADSGISMANFIPGSNTEIISYYGGYLSSYNSNLVKYNLSTGEYFTIMENPGIFSLPEISSTEWLLFTWSDYQLWKIKTNGDSLTQLTSEGLNFEYAWSPDGEKFVYKRDFPTGTYKTLIADKNGNNLFSIGGGYKIRIPAWSPDNKYIACGNFNGIYTDIDIINTETWLFTNLIKYNGNTNPNEQVHSIDFFPDSKHILWATTKELRKTNIETGVTKVISSTCDSQGFSAANISEDGQYILTRKTYYTYFDSKNLLISYKLFLLDGNGNEIREIVF
ncbi:MAG: PD40 domain-containing protein, partial [Chitinophagales bacterium]|nr:PD40 domain-containing protein [Chitinophagales bacterium]MBP9704206.1 PD40 domain-containing protein [Chitinophagales bacterium]